jgi:hypothetical protein
MDAILIYGVTTFCLFRQDTEYSSIIDLFLSSISSCSIVALSLIVVFDFSLGSDHRFLILSLTMILFWVLRVLLWDPGSNGIGFSRFSRCKRYQPYEKWNKYQSSQTQHYHLSISNLLFLFLEIYSAKEWMFYIDFHSSKYEMASE